MVGWARVTLGGVGALGAIVALGLMLRHSLVTWSRTLVLTTRTHRAAWKRGLRSPVAVVLTLSVLVMALVIPWPLTSSGTMVVRPATSRAITAADSGVVAEVFAAEGARLVAGEPVVKLFDYEVARDRLRVTRAVDSLAFAEVGARAAGRVADAEALAASRRSEEAQWTALERRAERLTLRAPIAGTVLTVHPEDLVGRQVRPGDSLLVVATLDTVEVRIALSGAGATRVRPGDVVHVVSYADPGTPWTGRVRTVSTQAVGANNAAGVVEARVQMTPNDAWRFGDSGEASVELGRSNLFGALWWKLRQWVRADLWL